MGTATSPILHGDQLFIVNDNEEQSYIAALDKKTGEERWQAKREEGSNWPRLSCGRTSSAQK